MSSGGRLELGWLQKLFSCRCTFRDYFLRALVTSVQRFSRCFAKQTQFDTQLHYCPPFMANDDGKNLKLLHEDNWSLCFFSVRRGFIMGVWNSHTSVGNILGSLIAGVFVSSAWGMSFIVPGIIIAFTGILCFFFLVESQFQ